MFFALNQLFGIVLLNTSMRNFIDIINAAMGDETHIEETHVETENSFSEKFAFLQRLDEKVRAKKEERFIKHRKADFKKRYGNAWEKVLYATANKMFHKK